MRSNDYTFYEISKSMKNTYCKYKEAILSTFIFGLVAHCYCFTNYLPTWDGLLNTESVGATLTSGRWLLKYVGYLFSNYNIPWFNGIISLFFICLSVIMIIEMFNVKNKLHIIITAGLFVTFPTIVSTFAFMFTADCYMLSFAFSVAAVYFCWKYKKLGFLLSIPLCCFSIAIYQSYISVSIILVVLLFINDIIYNDIEIKDMFKHYWRYVVGVVLGLILYVVVLKVLLKINSFELSSYQGINSVGLLSVHEMLRAFGINIVMILSIFGIELFNIEGRPLEIGLYSVINIVILLLILVATILIIVKKKIYKKPLKLIILFVSFALLPISACIILYASVDTKYCATMDMAVCFIYFVLVLYIDKSTSNTKLMKIIKSVSSATFCLLILYNCVNANVNYSYMNLRYDRTIAMARTVYDDISDNDEYGNTTDKIAIIGAKSSTTDKKWNPTLPSIRGCGDEDTLLITQNHYIKLWYTNFGLDIKTASNEEIEQIIKSEDFANMPSYPQKGYVSVINNIVVVKISNASSLEEAHIK